jgi:cell division protein FtsB
MIKQKILSFLILVVGLVLIVNLSRQIVSSWRAGERIERAQRKVEEARQENRELKEELRYVQSDEFLEREARDKLHMVKEGEMIVVVPKEVVEEELDRARREKEVPEEIPNWKLWKEAFFGR